MEGANDPCRSWAVGQMWKLLALCTALGKMGAVSTLSSPWISSIFLSIILRFRWTQPQDDTWVECGATWLSQHQHTLSLTSSFPPASWKSLRTSVDMIRSRFVIVWHPNSPLRKKSSVKIRCYKAQPWLIWTRWVSDSSLMLLMKDPAVLASSLLTMILEAHTLDQQPPLHLVSWLCFHVLYIKVLLEVPGLTSTILWDIVKRLLWTFQAEAQHTVMHVQTQCTLWYQNFFMMRKYGT